MNILVLAEGGFDGEGNVFFDVIGGGVDHDLASLELYGDDVDGFGGIFGIFFIFIFLFLFFFRFILLHFGFLFFVFVAGVPV